ncbi:MAG: IS200/IS605 family transposase [Nitrososphaerota archaeon]|nr:IS200/IS605 family transposase [Nitrososphaerota archaeon]MDG6931119.1 IS200/IS605 family transposase [Nitrososphaerota archaeon]
MWGPGIGESNFVFTPKYRRDAFVDGKVACLESFAETCYKLGVRMEACEFGPDHVHLFVSGCRKYSVPFMAQMFKGASSRKIRGELWGHVKDKLWGDSFWSDGYFYRSVGSTTAEAVQYYVENSQKKHWAVPDYEEAKIMESAQIRLTDFI